MSLYRRQLVPIWQSSDLWRCTQFLTCQVNTAPVFGPLQNVLDALDGCSAASLDAAKLMPVNVIGGPLGVSAYPSVRDRLQLSFRSAAGNTGKINVPAPVDACFLPDHKNVNTSNPLVAALLTAIFANLGDTGGSPWVTLISGVRMRVRSTP